jgi:sugar lactone lactonase YvrE
MMLANTYSLGWNTATGNESPVNVLHQGAVPMIIRLGTWLGVLMPLVLAHPARAAAPDANASDRGSRYVVDPTWPEKPREYGWGAMPGIATDKKDNVWIFTRARPPVQVFDGAGKFVRAWASESILIPHHIRVDHEGHIWVTDIGSHTVQKYTVDGKLLQMIGTSGKPGCDATHMNKPADVTVLPSGDIFVADGYGNRRIVHFDKTGKFVKDWGEEGTQPGQFALPHSIVSDSQKRLYVADRENARVQVFDTDGKLLDVWDKLMTPWGLYVKNDDEIWICGSSQSKADDGSGYAVLPPEDQVMVKVDHRGQVLLRVPLPMTQEPPGKPGAVDWVHGIALDSIGNIYVGDIQGKRVQKYTLQRN